MLKNYCFKLIRAITNILKYITIWSCLIGSFFILFVSQILIRFNGENNSGLGENILAYSAFTIISCISFLALIRVLKEIYDWNNGYSRNTGELWIEDFSQWSDGRDFFAGDDHNIVLNLEYLKPDKKDDIIE